MNGVAHTTSCPALLVTRYTVCPEVCPAQGRAAIRSGTVSSFSTGTTRSRKRANGPANGGTSPAPTKICSSLANASEPSGAMSPPHRMDPHCASQSLHRNQGVSSSSCDTVESDVLRGWKFETEPVASIGRDIDWVSAGEY